MKVLELNQKNPKISSSCSFYKDSQSLEKRKTSSDLSQNFEKMKANKTNSFPKDDEDLLIKANKPISPIDEFPSTWKKGAPKVNSSKLPSAFGTIFHKTVKNKDPIKNIENIVNMQEYKQAVQMLSPLKREEKPPRNKETSQFSKRARNRPKKNNPLEPLKSYMQDFYRISQDFDNNEFPKSLNNILQKAYLINSKLKLEEMITISIKKTGNSLSSLKKMLHAPGLLLYALKEIPIKNPETRHHMKEWISIWQSKFQESPYFIKVLGTFWNTPEGHVSVLMELMPAGSLQGLIDNIGGLSESMLKKIAKDISLAIRQIHKHSRFYEGHLSPEQVLVDHLGNLKISLGLSNNRFTFNGSSNISNNEKNMIPITFSQLFINNPNYNSKVSQEKRLVKRLQANDLYNFGLILLFSAIGDLDIMVYSEEEYEKIQTVLMKAHENKGGNMCCLLHSETTILKRSYNYITLLELLQKKQFSNDFINFLCHLLRFNAEERTIEENFINKKRENHELNLEEAINLAHFNDNLQENFSNKLGFLDKIIESLKVVLPNCEKWITKEDYRNYLNHLLPFDEENEVFKTLEKELGINKKVIFEKIKEVFKGFGFLT